MSDLCKKPLLRRKKTSMIYIDQYQQRDSIKVTMTPTAGFVAGISVTFSSGTISIDWKDGTVDNFTSGVEKTHTYANAGIYVAEIYGSLINITKFVADSSRITKIENFKAGIVTDFSIQSNLYSGILDLSQITITGKLSIYSNPSLSGITFSSNANAISEFYANNCNISNTLNLSNVAIGGIFRLRYNANLTGFTFKSSGNSTVSEFTVNNCNIGSIDLSNVPISGLFSCASNANLSSIVFRISGNGTVTSFNASGCNFSILDLSSLPISTSFVVTNNPNLTSITFKSSGNSKVTLLQVYSNKLTGTLDLSNVPVGSNVQVYSNSLLTGITFASSGNSQVAFIGSSCGFTSIDFSNVPLGYTINVAGCSNLTSLTFAGSGNGTIELLRVYNCNMDYFNTANFSTSLNNAVWKIYNNSMTAAEVNHILVDIDSVAVDGYTGRSIDIGGTNADPDSSSGGYDGYAAKASLEGKGFTVNIT